MKKSIPAFVGLVLVVGLLFTSTASAAVQVPQVPAGHPRVYLRPADVTNIQSKILLPEFQGKWNEILSDSATEYFSAAFVYLITGDTSKGNQAITDALTALQNTPSQGGVILKLINPMHQSACVYDWCYDLLTTQQKTDFITEFKRLANTEQPFYPAQFTPYSSITGHICESPLLSSQLPAGVAIYDEDTEMYDAAAQLFFDKFVPARNYLYWMHKYWQGDSYFGRFENDMASAWLFRQMGAGDVYTPQMQYVPYGTLYNTRPDRRQFRRGDCYDQVGKAGKKQPIFNMAAHYYQDEYLLNIADEPWYAWYGHMHTVFYVIFRPPGLSAKPLSELPKTKFFPDPMCDMIARTGWELDEESRDAVVSMRIGGCDFKGHTNPGDFGSFQIYYRGALAIATGVYQNKTLHDNNYHEKTISHNGLLIFDPNEPMWQGTANDGGQRCPGGTYENKPQFLNDLLANFRKGYVTAWQFGPNTLTPDYSYISGDITEAYTDKVQKVTRSMVTLNLQDTNYPASLIVFDRVTSSNPTFKKTWLLHSIEEPNIATRTITIERTAPHYPEGPSGGVGNYAGKLVTESILPTSATVTKIGGPGYDCWLESVQTNFPPDPNGKNVDEEDGMWRIEVSPDTNQAEDFFLHVMTVMDDTEPNGPNVLTVVDNNDAVVGVRLLDRAVVFGKDGTLLTDASFAVPGTGTAKILVCDLEPGIWSVSRADQNIATGLEATSQGSCIYFEGPTGLDEEYFLTVTEPNYASDFDGDSDVDFNDLAFIAGQWLSDTPQAHPQTGKTPDLKADSSVNFGDLAIFNKDWLKGVESISPRALYEFEGNYNNSTGRLAGTPVGDATIVYDSDRNSHVLSVDGSGDYVKFGNTSVSGIDTTVTIACWVKTSSLPSLDSLVTKGYAWRIVGNSGPARFSTSGPTNNELNGTINVADGTWHHVAAVYDGAKKYLYVDGQLDTSVDCTGSLSTSDIYIFAAGALLKEYSNGTPYAGFPKFYFNGLIDDVRVYDIALTPGQIQQLAAR